MKRIPWMVEKGILKMVVDEILTKDSRDKGKNLEDARGDDYGDGHENNYKVFSPTVNEEVQVTYE